MEHNIDEYLRPCQTSMKELSSEIISQKAPSYIFDRALNPPLQWMGTFHTVYYCIIPRSFIKFQRKTIHNKKLYWLHISLRLDWIENFSEAAKKVFYTKVSLKKFV